MAATGLQGVDRGEVEALHRTALGLGAAAAQRLRSDWRRGLPPRTRAAATLAAIGVETRLTEALSWLLTAQAVALGETADPGPAAWRAAGALPELPPGPQADLAAAVEQLYRRVVRLDAEVR